MNRLRLKRKCFLGLFFLGIALTASSQNPFAGHERTLNTIENRKWDKKAGWIRYEQRVYRNPFRAIDALSEATGDTVFRKFEPLMQGISMGTFLLGDSAVTYASTGNSHSEFSRKQIPYHWKRYKFDFWLQPVFAARFGYRFKTVESTTSILLNTQVILWPGMAVTGGILFPVTNDMDNRPMIVRPGPIYANQFWHRGADWVSATIGTFYNDQYGVNVQYRRADLSKPWSFGLEAGLTGQYYYPRGGIYYTNPSNLLLLADVSWRHVKTDVTVKVSGGQYLASDRGVRLDFIRQFTNVEVGLYAMKTRNGSTAGFNFAIPIAPGKIAQNNAFRIRTTDEFRWEYSYTRGYKIGERYRMGYQLDQRLRQYHTGYLTNQYRRYK